MANPTAGFGLRPVRRYDGAAPSWALEEVEIAYNEASVIAQGDLVVWLATGQIDLYAAAGLNTAGVFMGCKYRDPNLGYTVWRPMWNAIAGLTATDKVKALIIRDPQVVYEVRLGGATIPTINNVNNTADLTVGTPSAATGQSVALLDSTTLGVVATRPLRMIGFGQEVGNNTALANSIVEVVLNTQLGIIPPINTL